MKSIGDGGGVKSDVDEGDSVVVGVLELPSVCPDDATSEDVEDATESDMEFDDIGTDVSDPEAKDTEMEPTLIGGPVEVLGAAV
jgi:hypothetical protein